MDKFWTQWMTVLSAGIILFGLAYAVAGAGPLFAFINDPANETIFGTASPDANIQQYQAFTAGLIGATTAGWGIFMLFVARNGFARRERWAWLCFAIGIDVWFVIDTGFAVIHGAVMHVGFNVVMLVLVAIPLAATWRDFFAPRPNAVPGRDDRAIAA